MSLDAAATLSLKIDTTDAKAELAQLEQRLAALGKNTAGATTAPKALTALIPYAYACLTLPS